jgi:predicted nucleic acid-binding protein
MTRSTANSRLIDKNVRRAKRASLSLAGFIGAAKSDRWLVLPDTTVLLRGVTGRPSSPNRDLLEAVVLGAVNCVLSHEMRAEATTVLGRPAFGSKSVAEVDEVLGPVWRASTFVEMLPDNPGYVRFVRDPNDVHILRTAVGVFLNPELAQCPKKFIVTGDGRAFRSGTNWNGFECISARAFMERLRDAIS